MELACSVTWKLKGKSGQFPSSADVTLELPTGLKLEGYVCFRQPTVNHRATAHSSWMHLYPGETWWEGPLYSALSPLISNLQNREGFPEQALEYALVNSGEADPFEALLLKQELTYRAERLLITVLSVFEEQALTKNRHVAPPQQLRLWKSRMDGEASRLSGALL